MRVSAGPSAPVRATAQQHAATVHDLPPPSQTRALSAPPTLSRGIPGVKLTPFDPHGGITAKNYLADFHSYLELQAIPVDKWALLLTFQVQDKNLKATMQRYVATGLSPFQHYQMVAQIFIHEFTANPIMLQEYRMRLARVSKQIDEPIERYIQRWEEAYDKAYPDSEQAIAEKIAQFLRGIDSDITNDYMRYSGADVHAAPLQQWSEFKSRIVILYSTRRTVDAVAVAHQRVAADHALSRMQRRSIMAQPFDAPQHSDYDPFTNPSLRAETRKRINQVSHEEYHSDASDSGPPSHTGHQHQQPQPQNHKNQQKRNPNINFGMHDKKRFKQEHGQKSFHNSVVGTQLDANMRPASAAAAATAEPADINISAVTDRRPKEVVLRTAAEYKGNGVNNIPLGERKYAPSESRQAVGCTGHRNACGLRRHTWDYCPRNPDSPRFNIGAKDITGKHPHCGTDRDTDPPPGVHAVVSVRSPKVSIRLSGKIYGTTVHNILADTGSEKTLMSHLQYLQLGLHTNALMPAPTGSMIAANNEEIIALGNVTIPLTLYDTAKRLAYTQTITVTVMETLNCSFIMGYDALLKFFGSINLESHRCEFKYGLSPDANSAEQILDPARESRILVHKGVCIPAKHTMCIIVSFESQMLLTNPDTIVLCEPTPNYDSRNRVINIRFPSHVCTTNQLARGQYQLVISNDSSKPVMLREGLVIGLASIVASATDLAAACIIQPETGRSILHDFESQFAQLAVDDSSDQQ